MSRFEIVRTNAGWHTRFVAANSRTVWTTEVYSSKRYAIRAITLITNQSLSRGSDRLVTAWLHNEPTEIREIDERTVLPASLDDAAALGAWSLTQSDIAREIKAGRKIHAIKELRSATHASLLQAKNAVESCDTRWEVRA